MKKGIQKILAICTVLTLVLSVLTGTLGAAASTAGENTFTVETKSDLPEGTNLLVGKAGQAFAPAVGNSSELNTVIPSEFTNNMESGSWIDILYRARDTYLIYDLGNKYDITNVFLLSRGGESFYPLAYDICIANTRAGLFEEDAVKASFINSEKEIGQYFTFDANSIPSGRYVAFKFPAHKINSDGSCIIRLAELGVYGTMSYSVTEQNTIPDGKTSLIAGKEYELFKNNGDSLEQGTTDNSHQPSDFTDGNSTNGGYIKYDSVTDFPCYVYDLGSIYTIEEILLISRSKGHETAEYNVRIAYTKSDLFDNNACKVIYINDKSNPKLGQLITFNDGKQPAGRYVAFEIVDQDVNAENKQVRISELAVYGKPAYDKTDITSATDADIPADSLISGKNYTVYTNKGEVIPDNAFTVWGNNGTTFTDGKVAAGSSIGCSYEQYGPMCFVYDLGGTYTIDKVLQISRPGDLAAVAYNVRIADSMEDLFKDNAYIVNYTAGDINNPVQGQLLTFTAGKCPVGRYVAFEMLDPTNRPGDDNARIAELAVYGEKVALKYDYNKDDTVDILDLIRLKKYAADSTTDIDLTAKGEADPETDSAAALVELRKYLLG